MAYRVFKHGDIITAADWNEFNRNSFLALDRVSELEAKVEPPSPTLLAVAATAALASASQKPLRRRALLGLWRKA